MRYAWLQNKTQSDKHFELLIGIQYQVYSFHLYYLVIISPHFYLILFYTFILVIRDNHAGNIIAIHAVHAGTG